MQLALPLFVLGGALAVVALVTIVLAPVLASRAAAVASRPRLERRASGDDRMRALISAQIDQRYRKRGMTTGLTRTGLAAGIGALASWIAAGLSAALGAN